MDAPAFDRLRALAASWRETAATSRKIGERLTGEPRLDVLAIREEATRSYMLDALATELEQALEGDE